ncbi:MAG TPA: FAD-dependent monooxygenase [Micromonosporaceae bacterium]
MIIGAGVAGTVAAMALQKAGIEPVIYEAYQHSTGLRQGVYLTVAVNGLDALRVVGADHVVLDHGFPTGLVTMWSGTGKRLGALPLGPVLDGGRMTHTIRRDQLYRGLYEEAVGRGIQVEHGRRLVAATRTGTGVRAEFSDGSTAEADVLIGADGVHSTTRSVIDPNAPRPRYTGLGDVGGFVRSADLATRPGEYRLIWGRDCFFGYTVSPDGEIWWFANPRSGTEVPPEGLRQPDQVRERLLQLLAPDRTPGSQIVRADAGELRVFNQYDIPAVPKWHNDAMVIIGDAAHAVAPATGQGASLAAEDAVILAQCLRDRPTVSDALATFEALRRDRVQRVVKWGARMNNTKRQGVVGRAVRDLILPLILKIAARPEEMEKMSWLHHHHIDWDKPVAPKVAAGTAGSR